LLTSSQFRIAALLFKRQSFWCLKPRVVDDTRYGNMKRILQTLSTLFIQSATRMDKIPATCQLSQEDVQFSSSISCRLQDAAKNTPNENCNFLEVSCRFITKFSVILFSGFACINVTSSYIFNNLSRAGTNLDRKYNFAVRLPCIPQYNAKYQPT